MFLPMMRDRVLVSLAGAPDVFESLLAGLLPDDPAWDFRPDPQRYTIREVLGHLAALEGCWVERLGAARAEDGGQLPVIDLPRLEAEYTAPNLSPDLALAEYRERRTALVALLKDLSDAEWRHVGHWQRGSENTPITIEEQAMFFAVHDGYHTSQVAQWLSEAPGR